jgi:hypothetical protein
MSGLRDESVELLLEVEEKLTALLRVTAPDDHRRFNRLTFLIERTRHIRRAWRTRWEGLDAVIEAHEFEESTGGRSAAATRALRAKS